MPEDVLVETDNEILSDDVEVPEESEIPEKSEDTELSDEEKEEKEKLEKEAKEKEEKEDKPFPYERPSIADIKAKYPEFFKDFPTFRDSIFREVEYTKMFPTIEDAKEAVDDVLAFNGLRDSVLAGKSEDIIDAIEQTDKKAALQFATGFLPALYKKNQEFYAAAVTPLFEKLARTLYNNSDENTRNAALVLAHFMWGKDGDGVVKGEKTFIKGNEESAEEKRLREDRSKFESEQYEGFRGAVLSDLSSQRRALITRGLDPQKTMTDSQKEMLIERIEKLVDQTLVSDASHMSVMNARWLRSKREGFNNTSKEKIVSAYLSRAKQVIPSIRDKERDAFFGTKKKASEKKIEEIDNRSSKKEVVSGRVAGSQKEVLKPSKELYRKMSDLEILSTN